MVALEPLLRREILTVGKKLAEQGLVLSTYGSVSALLDADLAICTPAGSAKGQLSPGGLVKRFLREDRQVGPGKPTSAFPLHAAIYGKTQAKAILHAQPPAATALLKHKSQGVAAGVAKSAALGTVDVLVVGGACASRAAKAAAECQGPIAAVFVDGLGLFTWGKDLADAMSQLQSLESAAASAPLQAKASKGESVPVQAEAHCDTAKKEGGCGCSGGGASHSCTGCGRCTNNGGVLPSARQEAIKNALEKLSNAQLVALVAEAAREVLSEKGLL